MQRLTDLSYRGSGFVFLAAALGLIGLASCSPKAPEGGSGTAATPAAMTQEQKIARGKYLTTIGSCLDCHTLYSGRQHTGPILLAFSGEQLMARHTHCPRTNALFFQSLLGFQNETHL